MKRFEGVTWWQVDLGSWTMGRGQYGTRYIQVGDPREGRQGGKEEEKPRPTSATIAPGGTISP